MTLGLALIAKDEEQETLPRLLASIEGAFDQVALLDTGSTDRTIEVFTEWAKRQDLLMGYVVEHFEWVDDFAAARNAAGALLETDWLCWADCDERIEGPTGFLRHAAVQAPADIAVLRFPYDVGDPAGCHPRERLARRGTVRWDGRVHERPLTEGKIATLPGPPKWVHCKEGVTDHRRNLRLINRWVAEEPENPAALLALSGEKFMLSDDDPAWLESAIADCRRFLDLEAVREELSDEEHEAAHWALEGLRLSLPLPRSLLLQVLHLARGRTPDFWLARSASQPQTPAAA